MEIAIKVIQLIMSLSLLVFVHELGHYLTARMFGIRVEKFYLFFDAGGFSIFKFRIGETTFGLGWVPFGGYCKIAGMIDESMDTEALKSEPQPWEFRSKPAWQRLIVMVGGVVMNVATAIVIYIGMSWHWGDSYIDNSDLRWGYAFNELGREVGFRDGDRIVSFDGEAVEGSYQRVYSDMVIGGVREVGVIRGGGDGGRGGVPATVTIPEERVAEMLDSPEFMTPRVPFVIGGLPEGAVTPLAVGDSLVALNGMTIDFFDQWRTTLGRVAGTTVELTVVRDGAPVNLSVAVSPEGQLGVFASSAARFFSIRTRDYSLGESVPAGFRKAGAQISGYWDQLGLIVKPETEAYKSVGSLISIGSIFPGVWDWFRFWSVTAFLSIILAVMNILPIPALDGGHTMFLLWEVVTRRRPSDKFLEWAQMTGMFILLAIMVLAFWNDIYRFFIK
ncbi:MAG: RIP metalloprotease RseP [Alistipes sp.]|jgi:regulator of sigma E protease|nr:RIP metalloprotease RseP [Alistipes sp.]